jgi:hypothetical protein
MSIKFRDVSLRNSSVQLGGFFQLLHASEHFSVTNASIIGNVGQLFILKPP